MALRIGAARATRDFDLLAVVQVGDDAAGEVEEALSEAALLQRGDGFTFKVRKVQNLSDSRTVRAFLEVRLDGKKITSDFPVDLGYRRYEPAVQPDYIVPNPVIRGAPLPAIAVYPLPQHIADKACAMFEVTTTGEESDRFRDLFDLAWIAHQPSFDIEAESLTQALGLEQERRAVRLPNPFDSPSNAWRLGFERLVQDHPEITTNWPGYEEILVLVDRFLNGAAAVGRGRWDADHMSWDTR